MRRAMPVGGGAGRHNIAGNERGQTLLEYAVVMLTVLTAIFGVFETGRLILAYTTLAEAVRAGARYAIVHGADCSGACVPSNGQATAQNVAASGGITLDTYGVSYIYPAAAGTPVPGTLLTVTATYTFVPVTPLVALSVPLSSTTEGMVAY